IPKRSVLGFCLSLLRFLPRLPRKKPHLVGLARARPTLHYSLGSFFLPAFLAFFFFFSVSSGGVVGGLRPGGSASFTLTVNVPSVPSGTKRAFSSPTCQAFISIV